MEVQVPVHGLSFGQLFAVLLSRQRVIWLALALTVMATIAITAFIPKSYTATADIFIDFKANDPLAGRQFSPLLDESYIQTQVDMILSEEVANEVIKTTGMMKDPTVKKMIAKEGDAPVRATLVTQVIKSLEVVLRKSSRVVEVRYVSQDPLRARDALNTALRAYMELVLRINSAPAKSRQQQYSIQLETLRQEIDSIQHSITDYQQTNGILEADERLDIGSRQLNELSSRTSIVQGLRLEANAKLRDIESMINSGTAASDIPEVARQTGVAELKLKLAELDRQMAEVGSVYGRNHPKFRTTLAEQEVLSMRLSRESQAALAALLAQERRFDKQEQVLLDEIQSKQADMLEKKRHRDVIGSYQRQLEGLQKIYNSAIQKYDELLIASTVNSVSLSVLRWAVAPYTHSKPKLRLNIFMSIPVGLLFGLGLVFLMELTDRRLRHVHDLERGLNMSVLGRLGERGA
jgi:succinoglycan biosynthesis transport protein ExoP